MSDGAVSLGDPVDRVEAPVTVKSYLLCAFAAFGGIFFGYDFGYINGVSGTKAFIKLIEGPGHNVLSSSHNSLITSIFLTGSFFGSLISGDIANWYGRRPTIIVGSCIYIVGCILQVASSGLALIVVGRLIAGFGVGFVSVNVVLYISDVSPGKFRGSLLSGFYFCNTAGLLLGSCVTYATESRTDTGSYRIPISIQFALGLILAIGLYLLPESPRYFVKKSKIDSARAALSRLRCQPEDSEYITFELAEIVANAEHESKMIPITGYWSSWFHCFTGSLGRKQQPSSYYPGWGAFGMLVCQFLVASIGVTVGFDKTHLDAARAVVANNIPAVNAQVAFIAIYIFFYSSMWTPGVLAVQGEIFPLSIRFRGIALSTAVNLFWSTVITVISPYMVNPDAGDLRSSVFFVWGSLCSCAFVYAYFFVPETKGLTLEQIDRMLEETTPRTSASWVPKTTYLKEYMEQKGSLGEGSV